MAIDHRSSVQDAGANPPLTSTGLIQSPDMGEGPNAVSWLVGDVNGDGKAEICQQYRNGNGNLGIIVYGWNGTAMSVLKQNDDMGQGPNAASWLIGDVNGDGKAEIVQTYRNGSGKLGMIVYGWNGTDMTVLKQNDDMNEGPNAVSWLIGDVNGDGKAEVCQQYANGNGKLGMIVYAWSDQDANKMREIWKQDDMGQGPNALTWLIGDVNGDGKAEICQLWDNGGALAINFYMWTDGGFHTTVPTSPGWGGSGEPATAGSDWFIGDVNEDGSAELCHWWSNNIYAGAGLYKYYPDAGICAPGIGAMRYYGSSAPPPVGFVLGDFRGKGRKELCEAYTVSGMLGMMLFTFFKGNTLKGKAEWARDNMKQGPNAITWLGGNFMGPIQDGQATVQREQICQLWNNNGKLDMIVYGWKNGDAGFQDGDAGDGDGGIVVLWPTA
jgi:hypothetical protein